MEIATMKTGLLIVAVFLFLSVRTVHCFYLPGVAPQDYAKVRASMKDYEVTVINYMTSTRAPLRFVNPVRPLALFLFSSV